MDIKEAESIDINNRSMSVSYSVGENNPYKQAINRDTEATVLSVKKQKSFSKKNTENISYKYFEDKIIKDFKDYIDKTYDGHYKTENDVQAFDAWIALGESTPTFRNTAIKYLWRYGKKNGNNKTDLMKTLHYTLMCLYVDHYKDDK